MLCVFYVHRYGFYIFCQLSAVYFLLVDGLHQLKAPLCSRSCCPNVCNSIAHRSCVALFSSVCHVIVRCLAALTELNKQLVICVIRSKRRLTLTGRTCVVTGSHAAHVLSSITLCHVIAGLTDRISSMAWSILES